MNKSAGSNPGGRGVDRDRWAFSESGPWILDPAEIRWSNGLVALRESVKAEVPILIRNRFAPPLGRCLSAGGRVGWALVAWKLRESRSEGPVSRAALARRLREAFESLGPAYIKVGQDVEVRVFKPTGTYFEDNMLVWERNNLGVNFPAVYIFRVGLT